MGGHWTGNTEVIYWGAAEIEGLCFISFKAGRVDYGKQNVGHLPNTINVLNTNVIPPTLRHTPLIIEQQKKNTNRVTLTQTGEENKEEC